MIYFADKFRVPRDSGAIAEADYRYMLAKIARQTAKDSDSDSDCLRGLLILRGESRSKSAAR